MINKLHYCIITVFILNNLSAQQHMDSSRVSFDRIFGESKLHKYNADTFMTIANRKVIYSGADCSITGYDVKGRRTWIKYLPENQCRLEAFMVMNPLRRGSRFRKGCELLVQYKDKSIYGVNVKTGKFYFIE
jgi:hypothetical protein